MWRHRPLECLLPTAASRALALLVSLFSWAANHLTRSLLSVNDFQAALQLLVGGGVVTLVS